VAASAPHVSRRPVSLRPMHLADATGLGAMHHQAWVDTYGAALPRDYFEHWTIADAVARWAKILEGPAEPGVRRLVAVDGAGEIVGFTAAGPSRPLEDRPSPVRPFELWGLYVARAHLGSGLGQRLLDEAVAPGQPAELWVFRDNPRAVAFYRRNGFHPDGAEYTDQRFPDLPEVRMVRAEVVPRQKGAT
jgi:ribosomal protein S18 acetylase RimI-like enzyme